MFANMGLKGKLLSGFIAVALIGAITGAIGVYYSKQVGESAEEVLVVKLPSYTAVAELGDNAFQIAILLSNLANPNGDLEMRKAAYRFDEEFKKADEAWKIYEPLPQTPEEAVIWKQFVPKWESWKERINKFVEVSKELDDLLKTDPAGATPAVKELRQKLYQMYLDGRATRREIRQDLTKIGEINEAGTISGAKLNNQLADKLTMILIISSILGLAIAVVIGWVMATRIANAVTNITGAAQNIALGDTGMEITYQSGDEVGKLAEAFRNLLKAQRNEIRVINAMAIGDFSNDVDVRSDKDELSRSLQRMADDTNKVVRLAAAMASGDLTVDVAMRSDKDEMSRALDSMVEQLNVILGEVNRAVSQVAAGSTQISQASQSLSSGATESAASLEEITASIGQIGSQARGNAENASQANGLAVSARSSAEKGNGAVTEMLEAMKAVQDSGAQIAKVVKMIDDIAFQTNILSLNAAVEAARAGRHGRGFAVVADAVRNLANRSANAAKDTAELVDSTIKRIQESHQIASRTAESLGEIVTNSVKVADLVGEIAAASNEQAQGVAQINQGLTQINQVTQQNTANAEETAAAAEELSTQSVELQRLMSRFKLKMNGHGAIYVSNQPHARILEAPGADGKHAMINAAKSGKLLDSRRTKAKAEWV